MCEIGGLEMKRGLDAVKIDSRILKARARAERSAQDRRAGDDISKLPADPHDFVCIADAFEKLAMRNVRL